MPILECRTPDGFARDILLEDGDEVSVGRSPENTLTEGGNALSRRHAVVRYVAELCVVHDLNSSNGTYLNGDDVTRPLVLIHGDTVTCGELAMTYVED